MSEIKLRPPQREDVDFFKSIPWCAALIADSNFTTADNSARKVQESTEDSFFAVTLQSPRTISHYLSLYRTPDPTANPPIQEVYNLVYFGNAVNGFPNIAHGGFLASVLDEVLGTLLTFNQNWANLQPGAKPAQITQFTAYLNVAFKAPVKTPGAYVATAKVVKMEKRKWFLRATIEDESRKELVVADSLFIEARSDPRL